MPPSQTNVALLLPCDTCRPPDTWSSRVDRWVVPVKYKIDTVWFFDQTTQYIYIHTQIWRLNSWRSFQTWRTWFSIQSSEFLAFWKDFTWKDCCASEPHICHIGLCMWHHSRCLEWYLNLINERFFEMLNHMVTSPGSVVSKNIISKQHLQKGEAALKPINRRLMEEILHQLRLVVYSILYKVLYIPGGCLGFLPSTGCPTSMNIFFSSVSYAKLNLLQVIGGFHFGPTIDP